MAGWGRMGIDEAVVMAGDVEVVVCGVRRGWMMAVVCGYDVVVVGKVGMVMMAFGVRGVASKGLLHVKDIHLMTLAGVILQEVMVESLPTMVDTHIKEQVKKQVPEQVRDQVPVYVVEGLILESIKHMCLEIIRLGHVHEEERGPSTSGNQEQVDDYDFWTDSYASDDDEIPTKQVSQDIMEEVSLTIDEAKLKKMADERC
ncbi:hypothetical protein Tco_1056679 [Tanacetum coccineum]|uniref:Uncharacterized protein n=1 Tax=Tanacetum coccineum TaxID=301880 RepID=A0ABQ5H388_9ASTR